MNDFEQKDYRVFDLFENQWALAAAGTPERFNCCTLSWGGMGTLWSRSVLTVYVHPARYTHSFLTENEYFTVSFFPEDCRKALALLGARSGRDGDKLAASGLHSVPMGEGIGFEEAELSFLCRKLCQLPFEKAALAPDIQNYYRNNPRAFPPDENGNWQPHWVFVGEILEVLDKRL